jgi:hypothetical protein
LVKRRKPGSGKTVTLKIPVELYRNLSELVERTGFRSVTEFALFVLRDVAAGGRLEQGMSRYPPRDVRLVRERLRGLGYIE